ncbi:MAG: hypothetical protein ACI8ZX_001754 [Planctomycetota bacterium]|jgi:hypothetical protein
MKSQKIIILLFLFFVNISVGYNQTIQKTGSIFSEVASIISSMPSDSGNHYIEPNTPQLNSWGNILDELLNNNYDTASDFANILGYQLINFTDTLTIPHQHYYILETVDSNYWGTYVYNPNYCRALVIQSPHAKKDANTGHQGIHVFIETAAMFYQVNGTHRCNSSAFSNCSGTTTTCSSTSTSEAYKISDLAHNTQSIFQRTTEVLFNAFDDTYFIQLHGFTKLSTDPFVILSNGTQEIPTLDYFTVLRANLYLEDTALTFKIAHIDTNWTRLRGFWNTQGRFINSSTDHCNNNANETNGHFFHIEQERIRLRSDEIAWNKMSNALKNTFKCVVDTAPIIPIPNALQVLNTNNQVNVYPNPTNNLITIESKLKIKSNHLIFNLFGQNLSNQVSIRDQNNQKTTINISHLPSGIYSLRLENHLIKIIKKD